MITKEIDQELEYSWRDFVKYAINSKTKQKNSKDYTGLYEFMQKYPDISHCIKYSLNQARSASVHASAVIIVPKKNKKGEEINIFNWLPMREIDGILVTEWEGLYCDKAGFLKEDILALKQLDKFQMIKKLIKRNQSIDIVLEEIPLEDTATFKLFKRGMNEDVFQFGSSGLKNYSIQVKPDTLEELTAMNALYRPGPMSSNAHTDFGLIKHGKKKPEYDYGLKEVTEKTFGLWVFQEQIMQAVVKLGGFSLADAENTRTHIKKFDKVEMRKGKERFIIGAIKKGCEETEAGKIWDKLVAFSAYGFNRSHSNMYAHMSYWCQFLKANHPLEFWTAALNFAKDDDVPKCISEMKKLKQGITLRPPSVNKSNKTFDCDPETQTIYWSLSKIKGFGGEGISVDMILKERETNGNFLNYDDFVKRFPKKITKANILNLIIVGAFDEIEGIKREIERFELVQRHYQRLNIKIKNVEKHEPILPVYLVPEASKNYYWILLQRQLTGYGDVDYRSILLTHTNKVLGKKLANLFVSGEQFEKCKDYTEAAVAGMIIYFNVRTTRKNEKYAVLNVVSNNDLLFIWAWPDAFNKFEDFLTEECKGKTVAISGKIKMDDYRGQQVLYLQDDTKILEL